MDGKIQVGILGATGTVGQNFIRLLNGHPWFRVSFLAASPRSAGKSYGEAVSGRWRAGIPIPPEVVAMPVHQVGDLRAAAERCALVFSAVSLDKKATANLEMAYAARNLGVVSNNSALRLHPQVPIIIPEINPHLLEFLPVQRRFFGWERGFITTKPNCGIQSYMLPLDALRRSGYRITKLVTANLQASSGAGYPGQSAMDVIDNILPLPSEEEKAWTEPQKVFGTARGGEISSDAELKVSSTCIRVPVRDGHTSLVWFEVENGAPSVEELYRALEGYRSEPQDLALPSAPDPVIRVLRTGDRPQPVMDREASRGMAVSLGRLSTCAYPGYRFSALSHNTLRGAAGGAVLTAELLKARGFLD